MSEFTTPHNHEKFIAKNLFESVGEIIKGQLHISI